MIIGVILFLLGISLIASPLMPLGVIFLIIGLTMINRWDRKRTKSDGWSPNKKKWRL